MSTTAGARWHALGASARGASHRRDGSPNQDALQTAVAPDAAVAAVADGHGGARHFRSADGARLAVETAVEVLTTLAPAFADDDAAARAQRAAAELPGRIVDGWRARVQAALAAQPLQAAEFQALEAAEGREAVAAVQADTALAYGATLLAALAVGDALVLLQLGDGDVLLVDRGGRTQRPLPADERLGGNLTTSLCRAGAEGDFRTAARTRGDTALVLLATDGYGNSFRSDADFLQVGGDLLALLRGHGAPAVERQLPDILDHASTHGSGDDITVTLLVSSAATEGPTALADEGLAPAPGRPRGDGARALPGAPGGSRRWVAALAVAAVAAVAWTQRERLAEPRPVLDDRVVVAPAPAEPAAPAASAVPRRTITVGGTGDVPEAGERTGVPASTPASAAPPSRAASAAAAR